LFNTLTVDEALEVDAEVLANYFGFDALLPVGRQNTFLNTVRLIQSQLQRLLESRGAETALSSMIEQLSASCTASQSTTVASEVTDNSQTSLSRTDDPRASEIAVLLSGGVDSSVALKLLLDQGHKVRAYYLKIWLEDELAHLNSCPWEEDLRYAQAGEAGFVKYIFVQTSSYGYRSEAVVIDMVATRCLLFCIIDVPRYTVQC
jgi:hypothetical protein